MLEMRGEDCEYVKAYIQAAMEEGLAEGEEGRGSSGEGKGEAFPTQGSVMFPFRFPDELVIR